MIRVGQLHIFVAYDWGDEIDLEKAGRLVRASVQALPRRRRTPSSFAYRAAPLHVHLPPLKVDLPEIGAIEAAAGLTVFDFGAVSLAARVPFQLTPDQLRLVAGALADPSNLVSAARSLLQPVYQQLLPLIHDPLWEEDLSEEYFVFQFPAQGMGIQDDPALLASLVHLESEPLSPEEEAEAVRLHISYSPTDLFVPDWTAAVLVDHDCDETLQAIEFANMQLLEFRHIDNRLDASLAAAGRLIAPLTRSALPFWRVHARPLRVLGELKVEANGLFERAGNALKLVGDPYLARLYRLLATRFHLETWEENIRRKLETAEGVYQVVSDQASHFRTEFLEVIVVLLITLEIVLAFVNH